MLIIRQARPDEAGAISVFGRRTFLDTFAAQNNADDMEAYVSSAFSEAVQLAELSDPDTITLVAEDDDDIVAYAQLRICEPPACVQGPAPIELVRFYVDRQWHGRGIAQALMRKVEAAARTRARTLWLGVWERNERATAFYVKSGFVDVGSHVFVLGSDPQVDRVMAKPLPPSVPA